MITLPIHAKVLLYTGLTTLLVSVGAFPASANTNFPFLDQLDAVSSLTQYINTLHTSGPNSKVDLSSLVDNNYGSYASGAGTQLPITVYPSGKKNSPGIIYFPSTDGLGDPDGAGKLARGDGNPVGGGANDRGITVLKMDYGAGGLMGSYEDAILAVRHVIQNASMYGVDPKKVTLMGDSDGANLAVRVGASGKSGAAGVVANSPQTNMFTAMFKSTEVMQLAMKGMSCLSGSQSPLSGLQQVLTQFGNTINPGETITQSIYSQSGANSKASQIDMPAQMFQNCIQDFLAASPALTASPDTPPTFLAGFDNDPYADPQQIYGMQRKLEGLGIRTASLVTPGDSGTTPIGAIKNNEPIAIGMGNTLGTLTGFAGDPARVVFPTYKGGVPKGMVPVYRGNVGGPVKGQLTSPSYFTCDMCPNSPSHTQAYLNSRPKDLGFSDTPFGNFGSIPLPVNFLLDIIPFKNFAQSPGLNMLNEIRQIISNGGKAAEGVNEMQVLDYCMKCWPKAGQDNCPTDKYPYATPTDRAKGCPHLGYDPDYVCQTLDFVADVNKSYTEVIGKCRSCPESFTNQGSAGSDQGVPLFKCVKENNR